MHQLSKAIIRLKAQSFAHSAVRAGFVECLDFEFVVRHVIFLSACMKLESGKPGMTCPVQWNDQISACDRPAQCPLDGCFLSCYLYVAVGK